MLKTNIPHISIFFTCLFGLLFAFGILTAQERKKVQTGRESLFSSQKKGYIQLLDSAKKLRSASPYAALKIAQSFLFSEARKADTAAWLKALSISRYVYSQFSDHKKALSLDFVRKKLLESYKDTTEQMRVLESLAFSYNSLGMLEKTLEYRHKLLRIIRESKIQNRTAAVILSNQGEYFRNKNDFRKALNYNDTASNIAATLKLPLYAFLLVNRCEIFIDMANYDSAAFYASKAQVLLDTIPDFPLYQAFNYRCLGIIYRKKGDYKASVKYLKKGLEVAKRVNGMGYVITILKELSETEEEKGMLKQALQTYKTFKTYDDSIRKKTNRELTALVNLRLEMQQQEIKKIRALSKEKMIAQAMLSKQRQILWGLLLLAVLCALFLFYFIRSSRIKKRYIGLLKEKAKQLTKNNEKISRQKLNIENQNRLLEEKNFELDALNRENSSLIGIVSHDLKSPLRQIMGLVSVIRLEGEENLKVGQKECLHKIMQSSERASELIQKILSLEALESKNIHKQLDNYDIYLLVKEGVDFFEKQAEEKNIKIHLQKPENTLNSLVNKDYTTQIVQNLVSNAIKFSPIGKNIFISFSRAGDDFVKFMVKDEGPGLTECDMVKLFGKFQRLSARPTAGESSNGLGLSIVKKYTEAMNGSVWCESEEGKGATFVVKLPRGNV